MRPLYRWKSFWLGVLVLIFLGWSWKRSIHYYDTVSYGEATGGRGISLSQRDSGLIMTWMPKKFPAGFEPGFHRFSIMMGERNRTAFPELSFETAPSPYAPTPFRSFYLPHWFVILLLLFVWGAFLTLRLQRMKRQTLDSPSTPVVSR